MVGPQLNPDPTTLEAEHFSRWQKAQLLAMLAVLVAISLGGLLVLLSLVPAGVLLLILSLRASAWAYRERQAGIALVVLGAPIEGAVIWLLVTGLRDFAKPRAVRRIQPEPFPEAFVPELRTSLPLTLRPEPSAPSPRWWLSAVSIPVLAFSVGLHLYASKTAAALMALASVGLPIALLLLRQRAANARRLTVDDLGVERTDFLARVVRVPRTAVRRVALRAICLPFSQARPDRRLLLLGKDGRCLLRVSGYSLSYQEASQVAAALRVPIDPSWDRVSTYGTVNWEIPGAASAFEAHPVVLGALTVVVSLAALIVVGAMLGGGS